MRKRVLAVVVACAALHAGPAAAQGVSFGSFAFILPGPGEQLLREWDLPATIEGNVVVHFSAAGRTGTTVWSPRGGEAQLSALLVKTPKGKRWDALVGVAAGSQVAGVVTQAGGGVCSDVSANDFATAAISQGRNGFRVQLAGPTADAGGFSLTETRCGGPLSADVARVLPTAFVSARKLDKGGFDIDLRRSAPLATSGMTGTVESAVVVHVGRRPTRRRDQARAAGEHKRTRDLSVSYAIESVHGSLSGSASGYDGLCADLDACGARADWTLRPSGARGSLALNAFGPVRRNLRDLRAALGLVQGGNRRGIDTSGIGEWKSGATTLAGAWTRPGSTPCADRRHIGGGELELEFGRQTVNASLSVLGFSGPVRTSCPGPNVGQGPDVQTLARATVPLRAFAQRRIVLHFTRGTRLTDDGWAGATRASVTVVLRRLHTRVSTFTI